MKSIFNADDNAELLARVDQLHPLKKAIWGEMDVAQMMTHCTAGMNIAFGQAKCRRHWVGRLFGNIAKKRFLKLENFDRHIPTYGALRIEYECNFDEAKEKFIVIIKIAFDKGEPGLVKYPHPYFKTFKPGEWCQLNWRHLDHHLRQFEV